MMKKHMVPLSQGGKTTVHQGKGSEMASMPDRSTISGLAKGSGTMNDYAKASPAALPSPGLAGPVGGFDGGV